MSEEAMPSARLAAEIVDRLIKAGLLRSDKRDPLIAKIASGGMKTGDWKLEIELASGKADAA